MGLRDRFFRPQTAQGLTSWRLPAGIAVAVGGGLLGVPWLLAAGIGAITWLGLSMAVGDSKRLAIGRALDPFSLSEPWRRMMMSAQAAQRRLVETVESTDDGPLRDRLDDIARRMGEGLDEAWAIAATGDRIDATVRNLDPTRLRSNLATFEQQVRARGGDLDTDDTVTSLRSQIETVERLTARSDQAAEQLRTTQVRLDELVARANEVKLGTLPPDRYSAEVDALVIELEALHQAVEEVEGL